MADGHEAQAAWVARVLGVQVLGVQVLGVQVPAGAPAAEGSLGTWQAARGTAIAALNSLAGGIAKLEIPERDEALILLRAIRANLTEAPSTARQVDALRRYLETDDIIAEAEEPNGFGIAIRLREPLLAALATIRPEAAA